MLEVFSPKWLSSHLLYVVFSHRRILNYAIKSGMATEFGIDPLDIPGRPMTFPGIPAETLPAWTEKDSDWTKF